MKTVVNVHDLKTNYSKYLDQVVNKRQELVLGKNGKAVAKIVPLPSSGLAPRKLGGLKGRIHLSDDFEEPMLWLWDVAKNKK